MENTNSGGAEEKTWEEVSQKNSKLGRQLVIFVLGIILGLVLKGYASDIGWTMGAEDYKQSELTSDFDFAESKKEQAEQREEKEKEERKDGPADAAASEEEASNSAQAGEKPNSSQPEEESNSSQPEEESNSAEPEAE